MSSFFYYTRQGQELTSPIPATLDRGFVLAILHNEPLMKRLLRLPGLEDGSPDDSDQGPKKPSWGEVLAHIAFPFPPLEACIMTKTMTSLEDGVEAVHDFFPFKMTTFYKVLDKADGSLQLYATGTVRLLKPLHRWANSERKRDDDTPPIHVARIRCVLDELSKNGRDVDAALASEALAGVEERYRQLAQTMEKQDKAKTA